MKFLPSIVIIATWFDNRKALATSLAMLGLSVGGFIGTPLVQLLIDKYSWRGCLTVLSGIALNISVASALFRPVPIVPSTKKNKARQKDTQDAQVECVTDVTSKPLNGVAMHDDCTETRKESKTKVLCTTLVASFDITLFQKPSFLFLCATGFCNMFSTYTVLLGYVSRSSFLARHCRTDMPTPP
jgi:MFS family permease